MAAAAVGYAFSQRAVFLLVPVFAALAATAVLSIPAAAIDYDRARNLREEEPDATDSAAFLAAGSAALTALVVFALPMPETAERETPALAAH